MTNQLRPPRPTVPFVSRCFARGIILLLFVNACASNNGPLREFYQDRGLSHCVAGNCMDGIGKVQITETLFYGGHFTDYLPDGDGTLFEKDQVLYEGKWSAAHPEKEGVIRYTSREDGQVDAYTEHVDPGKPPYNGDKVVRAVASSYLTCAARRQNPR